MRFVDARAHLGSDEARVEAVRAWVGVPGLGGAALQASLTQMADVTDIDGARKRLDELTALVSVRPLSSVDWLSLAGLRLVTAQPYQDVLSALAMSSVTGPNEGSVMMQRGVFGLLQWEVLPADMRKRVIGDVAGAILGAAFDGREIDIAKNVLTPKSAQARQEIAGLLNAEGMSRVQLARIGL